MQTVAVVYLAALVDRMQFPFPPLHMSAHSQHNLSFHYFGLNNQI